MRYSVLAAGAAMVLAMQASPPAHAGLIGSGNSVQALFHFFDTLGSPPLGEIVIGEPEVNPPTPTSLASPVTIVEGSSDGATIGFTDTQITITNDLTATPFCSVAATSCPAGEFWAFEFQFSPGIDVTGATLDAATPADFRPTGTGIQLLSPTDVEVEVTNDSPALGDQLVLDLKFAGSGTGTTGVPEPASLALLAGALLGAGWLLPRRRSRRTAG